MPDAPNEMLVTTPLAHEQSRESVPSELLSLTDSAARRIAEMISSGLFPPGHRLPPERELAVELGISRGALREAFRTLESVGLLRARVGSGRFVTATRFGDPSGGLSVWMQLQPVADIIAVRRILEPAAILAIPASRLEETATQTRELLERMSGEFRRGSVDKATETHTEFHLALVRHATSRLHAVLLGSMIKLVESAQLEIFRTPAAGAQSLAKHVPMVEALEDGDVARAGELVAQHLTPVFAFSPSEGAQ